ncbi:hypothetical protein ANO11243_077060 [Dothideomycetidae sp. 11243]|nr:hypothetical protein ANO11243_077060 [fungal sp. No.11243]
MARFDKVNSTRIAEGLDAAKLDLLDLEPSQRRISSLSEQALYSLFESMHCLPVLQDEEFLKEHLDQPFRLVQTNQKISLPEYTPALASFLFSSNDERRQWALRGWQKFKRDVSGPEFDYVVKDQLKIAMDRVPITALQKDFMPFFWKGVHMILSKLNRGIITHHLRAMDTDLCKLALDHMQVDSPCFQDLLKSLQLLLEKAPSDVWDALGAISPSTVVEQVFNSPNFGNLMQGSADHSAGLDHALSWVSPFVRSIRPGSLGSACRALLHQTMTRTQNPSYPDTSRQLCRLIGLRSLSQSLTATIESGTVGTTSLADLLNVLQSYMPSIMEIACRRTNTSTSIDIREASLSTISAALTADFHLLSADRASIMNRRSIAPDSHIASTALWKAAVQGVGPEDTDLAAAILRGCSRVVALEALPQREVDKSPRESLGWKVRFTDKLSWMNDLLDRIQEFEGEALGLFLEDGADTLIALLFAGDKGVQQSAAATLRVLTSESSRRDAVRFMLDTYYTQTLSALSEAFKCIADARVFLPSTMAIKGGMDFIQVLCDSQDGILRTRSLSSDEMEITEIVWENFWAVIKTIYNATEHWSFDGHDKSMMVEFCRDAMDFAGQTFDTYSVIAGVLHSEAGSVEGRIETDKLLLESPAGASGAIVKWLRLRDEYLITKAVNLICKLLGRLQEVDLELPSQVITYIDDILSGKMRSKVPDGQKAELRRGLNLKHDDVVVVGSRETSSKSHKQGSLNQWFSNASTATITGAADKKSNKTGIDFAAWKSAADTKTFKSDTRDELEKIASSASPTLEKLKASGGLLGQRFGQKPYQPIVKVGQPSKPEVNEFLRRRQAAMERKAKLDRENIQRARGIANAGSGLSGIGVEGKDHSAKGQGVMVSSDESDESDDGGLDEELFGPSIKMSKRKDTVKSDAAGAIGLKREVKPTRVHRQIRTMKDMRARLQPNLSPLYSIILGWDYFHTGDYPPNIEDWNFRKVANSFRHVQDYRDTFQPLLTLEAWQGLVKAREEDSFKPYEIKIANRINVDSFIELSTTVSSLDLREIQVSEGDIILFSTSSKPTANAEAPHCLARVYSIKRKAKSLEIIYRVVPTNPLMKELTPGTVIHGAKIQSIIPLEREFGVLIGLEYYDLCDEIIKARPSPLLEYNDKQLTPLMSNYSVNKAQAKAIKSALDNDAFTLIQGPPGSGKTKTIVAIVGALLSDALAISNGGTRINAPTMAGAPTNATAPKKLLVCAPSNAAVDELVMRFKEGVKTTRGIHKKINVVRVGRSEAVNSAVVDVTLEELVNKKLGKVNGDNSARETVQKLMIEHKKVSDAFKEARDQIERPNVKAEQRSKLQDDINQLRKRKTELGNQIDNAKDAENAAGRTADLHKKKVQQSIIEDSHVICATLSGSGHQLFQDLSVEFETVIVDEAAQCVEMSALIPLKYGCAKCILVGDPKQLPPTVFSKEAAKFQYEQSLFVRMQSNFPNAVHLLDTQYRMHPDISAFPSSTFYDGLLLDGDDMAGLRQREWHQSWMLAPYRFFDVEGQQESARGHSLINKAEINVAMRLYERLLNDFRDYDFNNKIGIITPYKSQLRLLKETFSNKYGNGILEKVEFNTTDAFQGRESEIIIFSCVRASPAGNIGFLQDIRRMNVGLTRAKCSLWVLGNSRSLVRGQYWKKLVEDAQKRDLYTTGNLMSLLNQPSSNFPAKTKPIESKAEPLSTPVNVKAEPPTAPLNGVAIKPATSTRVIASKASDLALFKTGAAPIRSAPVKPEITAHIKQEKNEIKSENAIKAEVVKNEEAHKTQVKTEMKREYDSDRSRTGTPASVSASESRGSVTPSGRPKVAVPNVQGQQDQQPPQAVKRKAPPSIFMPKKKPPRR